MQITIPDSFSYFTIGFAFFASTEPGAFNNLLPKVFQVP
jgi:hypothetical protein